MNLNLFRTSISCEMLKFRLFILRQNEKFWNIRISSLLTTSSNRSCTFYQEVLYFSWDDCIWDNIFIGSCGCSASLKIGPLKFCKLIQVIISLGSQKHIVVHLQCAKSWMLGFFNHASNSEITVLEIILQVFIEFSNKCFFPHKQILFHIYNHAEINQMNLKLVFAVIMLCTFLALRR